MAPDGTTADVPARPAASAVPTEDGRDGFVRELSLLDATMIVAGSMIGSGIFIVSADIARQTGSAGGLLLTWVITGLLTVAAALSYGELAAMMPKAGGQYVFLPEAWSPLWGFLYGWTLFLVIQSGTIAAVAVAFAVTSACSHRRSPRPAGSCREVVKRRLRRRSSENN